MKNEENTNAGFIARRIEAESDPEAVLLTREAAEAFCDHYCRFPNEYDEDAHGVPLAESHICKNCPLTLAGERENTEP